MNHPTVRQCRSTRDNAGCDDRCLALRVGAVPCQPWPPAHRGDPRRCTTCLRPEDDHQVRHRFTHPAYGDQSHRAQLTDWSR